MIGIIILVLTCIPREDPPDLQLNLKKEYALPQILSENSGMIEYNNFIWFINDSGNDSVLYGYDRSLNQVTKTVAVKNTVNIDWEDITQNNDYIFIGDFGNNAGSRTNLRIIKISKSDLNASVDTVTPVGIIRFNFEDQTDFTPADQHTQFDCEAFIATDDQIILFTKDWINATTRLYSLPVTPGNYAADFITQWNVNGMITAAAWSQENRQLLLLGYTPLIPFIWIYSDFDESTLTYADAKKTDFVDFFGIQTEGLLITQEGTVLVSSEEKGDVASLYRIINK